MGTSSRLGTTWNPIIKIYCASKAVTFHLSSALCKELKESPSPREDGSRPDLIDYYYMVPMGMALKRDPKIAPRNFGALPLAPLYRVCRMLIPNFWLNPLQLLLLLFNFSWAPSMGQALWPARPVASY